ncbi:MAG: hypothetical protein U1E08_03475 [Coriobacteriia bacterium]|nr:hypothetical protein [Actinomycetota bacterium]MDZ4166739.1 hypothetical protein [Coriobacteriia bacterium]
MGILDTPDIPVEGRTVTRVRVDRIGNAGGKELWWVALAFEDESTKPAGMFTDFESADELGRKLAADWGVDAVVTHVV